MSSLIIKNLRVILVKLTQLWGQMALVNLRLRTQSPDIQNTQLWAEP